MLVYDDGEQEYDIYGVYGYWHGRDESLVLIMLNHCFQWVPMRFLWPVALGVT